MSFKDDFPDYARYDESQYYYSRVPPGLNSALQGLIIRVCKDAKGLSAVCNDLAARVPAAPTSNWGWDWLVNDLRDYIRLISQKKFPKYMDFILDFADAHYIEDRELVEDLNDAFRDSDFGYSLVVEEKNGGVYWSMYKEPDVGDDSIEEASIHVKDISEQAYEHLTQEIKGSGTFIGKGHRVSLCPAGWKRANDYSPLQRHPRRWKCSCR